MNAEINNSKKQKGNSDLIIYNKLGGLLLIPLIGLFIVPIRLLYLRIKEIAPIILTDTWSIMTSPKSELYHPLYASVIIYKIIINIIFIITPIIIIIFFLKRNKIVPKLIIIYHVGAVISNIIYILSSLLYFYTLLLLNLVKIS